MSSITAGTKNEERTNRWLLIGAAVLAVLAGILVFVALTNVGGGGSDSKAKPAAGDIGVLTASRTIKQNEKITADMLRPISVPTSQAVTRATTEASAVVGKVARTEIVEGQQISLDQVSLSGTDVKSGLAAQLPTDKVGFALSTNEISIVAGFVQPGDHVNVTGVFKEQRADKEITRVEVILQDVEVLAVAQVAVPPVSAVDAQGTPIAAPTAGDAVGTTSTRPEDVKPNPQAGSVTLALTPLDAQILAAARSRGDIFMELRPLGDKDTSPIDPTYYDAFGLLPLLPRR